MAATVELPTSAAPSLTYRPHLDGLRAVAVVMVFVFHAARPGLPSGFIGVDIFFVLSGYLITSVLLSQYGDADRIRLGQFYARRVRRLTPAVVLVVLAVALREAVWGSVLEAGIRLRESLATLFYFANWNLIAQSDNYFAEGLDVSPLRHAWSLAVEEQFYLVWPALLIGLLVWGRRRFRTAIAAVLLLVVASSLLMAAFYDPGLVNRAYYGTDTRIHQPLLGAALALLMASHTDDQLPPKLWSNVGWMTLGGLLLIAVLMPGASDFYFLGGSTLVAILTVIHLASIEYAPDSGVARVLAISPMRYLGKISYGFYLWHWPVILWIQVPDGASFIDRRLVNLLQFATTFAVAAASYALVEDPIRTRQAFRRLTRPRAVVGTGLLTLLLAGAICSVLLGGGADNDIVEAALQDRSYEPCPADPRPCVKVQSDRLDAPVIALVGDSTAQAYDPAMKIIAERYGYTYVQAAVGGCPLGHRLLATGTDGELHKSSNLMCYEELPGIYEELIETWDPDLIIATSWNETNQHITDGKVVERGTAQHLAEVEAALRDTARKLTAQGAELVFVDILPPGPSVSCLDAPDNDGGNPCDRPRMNPGEETPVNQLMAALADEQSNIAHINLTSEVCLETVCPLMRDGVVMRYDGGHLTGTASRMLAGPLAEAVIDQGVDLSALGTTPTS